MKVYKKLNIKGTSLENNQLEYYMEKIASDHVIKSYSEKETNPIYWVKRDYEVILQTYNLLSKHLKQGIKIHSAGEWILDNFYIIEETVKTIQKNLSPKEYKRMIGIASGKYKGFSRCYCLASEIVAFTECKINKDIIRLCLNSYQKNKSLSMDEIWNLNLFLKIAVISNISEFCKQIYYAEVQKEKAESIIKRIVENQNYYDNSEFNKYKILDDSSKYAFIEYLAYRLKEHGKEAIKYQEILDKEVEKLGLTVSEVIQKEHFQIANIKVSIGNCIKSIKEINRINFGELFSNINAAEDIMQLDPAGVYPNMDEDSKKIYREKIWNISKKTKISEVYIAEKLIDLAKKEINNKKNPEKSHIGYYIIDNGILDLYKALDLKSKKKYDVDVYSKMYIGCLVLFPIYFLFILGSYIFLKTGNFWQKILLELILYIPIFEIFVKIVNYILGKCKKPQILPKLDYENGIPKEASTMIVVPTILKSKEKVDEIMHKLEVYYLANKLENLYFVLLGDCSEEKEEKTKFDEEVIMEGLKETERLNKKYDTINFPKFHFLYRKRVWNESEGAFIGYERKRGLLSTFNKYISGKIENNFLANTIELNKISLPNIKYIITLDSDTNLVLNSAAKMIGAMDHILNIPIVKNGIVVKGYGIMQPRIGLDLSISQKTYLPELYSMQGGIDLYSNAVSDIYQDYFKEGIFTGKGIYNLNVYNEVLEGEIPENKVLSHDLLEGNYLRCGLIEDVILLDGYPLKYLAYVKRNHRWIRGDWQIIEWLNSKKLNGLSKFKIFDNLRRSLVNIFALIGILISIFNFKYRLLVLSISIISIIISFLLDIINIILFKESYIEGAIYADKKFSKDIGNIKKAL